MLSPGDIAVIGYTGDADDSYALLALVDISVGTQIRVTDKGVDATGAFQAEGESQRVFTTEQAISAGDVFLVVRNEADAANQQYPAALGTPSGGSSFGLSFQSAGDQLIVWQGEEASPRFIYALSTTPFDASYSAGTRNDAATALPPGLTNGTTAIDFDPEVDNVEYDRTNGTTGTQTELLALVANDANYTTSDTRFDLQSTSFSVTTGGGTSPITLPITFEDPSVDYELRDFEAGAEGPTSMIITDPTDATNRVVRTVRPASAVCYAGTTVGEETGFGPIPFAEGATTMSVRVWSPAAGIRVRLKVEKVGDPTVSVETEQFTTAAMQWETLVFDFANQVSGTAAINFASEYSKASIFFDFQCGVAGVNPTDPTYYWDDVAFGTGGGDGGTPETALLITGAVDGPLTGGVPKAIEFYVAEDIADLSRYGFGSANNADGTNGVEFAFPAVSASAGDFIYLASETDGFTAFFGFAPDYADGSASINGDDSLELFYDANGVSVAAPADVPSTTSVVDVFGVVGTDGTGQPWEYLDGWAYRNDATGPDGSTFVLSNWSFSGINALDNETTNATAATPFPIGTYSMTPPANPVVTFASAAASGDEGTTVTLTVQIDYPDGASGDVTVDVAFDAANSTATAADFTGPTPAQVTFNGTDGTADVTLALAAGDGFEGSETAAFTLTVSSGTADLGTPSTATVTIGDTDQAPLVTIAEARALGVGATVRIQGTVTRAVGNFSYVQQDNAALAIRQTGERAFRADVTDGTIAPGTTVEITGTLSAFNGLLQINENGLQSYSVTGSADVPAAQVITLAELASNGEAYESELVTIGGVTFVSSDPDTGIGTFAERTNYTVSDGTAAGDATFRVPNADDTSVDGLAIPAQSNVTGIVGQFDSSDPRDSGYQLLLVSAGDIENTVATETDDEAAAHLMVANPIRGTATVQFSLAAPGEASLTVYDMLGRQVATLAEGTLAATAQTASFDASALATGVYVVRLQTETAMISRTVTVVR